MPLPNQIDIKGPIAPPSGSPTGNIIYSVQLTTGMMVTNPEQFPNSSSASSQLFYEAPAPEEDLFAQ